MAENGENIMSLEVIPVKMVIKTSITNSKIDALAKCLNCAYRPVLRRAISLARELSPLEPRITRSQSRALARLNSHTLSSIHSQLTSTEGYLEGHEYILPDDIEQPDMVKLPTNSLTYLLSDQPLPIQSYEQSFSVEPPDMDWPAFLQNYEEYSDESDHDFCFQDHLETNFDENLESLLLPIPETELQSLWLSTRSTVFPSEQTFETAQKTHPSALQSPSPRESDQLDLLEGIKSDPDDPILVCSVGNPGDRVSFKVKTDSDANEIDEAIVSRRLRSHASFSGSSPCLSTTGNRRKYRSDQCYSGKRRRLSSSTLPDNTRHSGLYDSGEASNDSIVETGRITLPASSCEDTCGSRGSNEEIGQLPTLRIMSFSDNNRKGSNQQWKCRDTNNKRCISKPSPPFARRRRVGSLLIEPVPIDERILKCLRRSGFGEKSLCEKQRVSEPDKIVSPLSVSFSEPSVSAQPSTAVSPSQSLEATLPTPTPLPSLSPSFCNHQPPSLNVVSSLSTTSASPMGLPSLQTSISSLSPCLSSTQADSISSSSVLSSQTVISLSSASLSSLQTTISSSSPTIPPSTTLSSSSSTIPSTSLSPPSSTLLSTLVTDLTSLVPAPTIVQAFPVVKQSADQDAEDLSLIQPYEPPRTPTRTSPEPVLLGFPSPVLITPSVSALGLSASPQNSMLVTPTASRSPRADYDSGDEAGPFGAQEPSLGGIFDLLLQTGGVGRKETSVGFEPSTGVASAHVIASVADRQREVTRIGSCPGVTPGADTSASIAADSAISQSAGGAISARLRGRRPRQQQRRAELYRSVVLADLASRRQHEKQVAVCFLQRVKAAATPSTYYRICHLLSSFSTDGTGDQLALYDQLHQLLSPHQLLCSELPLFFSELVAARRSCVLERARAQQLVKLARRLQLAAALRPHQAVKIQRAITTLSSRFLSSSRAGEQLDIRAEMLRLHGVLQPVLRLFPQLLQELQQLVASEPPPSHMYDQTDQFQCITVDELSEQSDPTPSINASVLSDGELDDFCSVADAQPDLYGTERCPCTCHLDQEAGPRLKARSHHCFRCGLKFIDGRVFVQTGKVLRPASIVYCGDSESWRPQLPPEKTGRSVTRRRSWSHREDFVLMDSVRRLGDEEATFLSLRAKLGGRSVKMIRERFHVLIEKLRCMQDNSADEEHENKERVSETDEHNVSACATVNKEESVDNKVVPGFEQASVSVEVLDDGENCVPDETNSVTEDEIMLG